MRKLFLLSVLGLMFSSVVNAADILLSWDAPVEREDGSPIESLDRYEIRHLVNNVEQEQIEVQADKTTHTVGEAAQGTHTFMIRAVEDGLAGKYSNPTSTSVSLLKAQIGTIIITVEVRQ